MHKYFIHEDCKEMYHAGPKATRDCEEILLRNGFQQINMHNYREEKGISAKIRKRLELLKLLVFKPKSLVMVPHPMYIGALYIEMLKIVKCLRKIKIIFVIHDLESLRGMYKVHAFDFLDNEMVKIGDVFIAHNEKMKEYLVKKRK